MCSPSHIREVALLCAVLAACSSGHHAATVEAPPPGATPVQTTPLPTIFPAHGNPPPPDPASAKYADDENARNEGARLYDAYNCSGCHFHGAGGIGPSLMDNDWIYGGSMEQIYSSIEQGRPDGMPSWGHKLSPKEIWEIAAYVHSLPAADPAGAASLPNPPLPPVRPEDAKQPDAPSPALTAPAPK